MYSGFGKQCLRITGPKCRRNNRHYHFLYWDEVWCPTRWKFEGVLAAQCGMTLLLSLITNLFMFLSLLWDKSIHRLISFFVTLKCIVCIGSKGDIEIILMESVTNLEWPWWWIDWICWRKLSPVHNVYLLFGNIILSLKRRSSTTHLSQPSFPVWITVYVKSERAGASPITATSLITMYLLDSTLCSPTSLISFNSEMLTFNFKEL